MMRSRGMSARRYQEKMEEKLAKMEELIQELKFDNKRLTQQLDQQVVTLEPVTIDANTFDIVVARALGQFCRDQIQVKEFITVLKKELFR